MDRRLFLKLTGLAAAAGAFEALPVAAERIPSSLATDRVHAGDVATVTSGTRLAIREPGTYQITGRVQLQEPLVEISGFTHTQWISWSDDAGTDGAVAGFTMYERFDRPGLTPDVRVRGGRLEALTIVPMDLE